jgi:hypothetical protein
MFYNINNFSTLILVLNHHRFILISDISSPQRDTIYLGAKLEEKLNICISIDLIPRCLEIHD